jgi:integrase
MPARYHMTWVASTRRWKKMLNGKVYVVSCRQLGVPETKEASWRAANQWWEEQRQIAEQPTLDERVSRANKISRLVTDFAQLDEDSRREAVDALLGEGTFNSLTIQAERMLASVEETPQERTVSAQVEAWKNLLRNASQSGQMSSGRFDAYCRKIKPFAEWLGETSPIDVIDETSLEGFYSHISEKVAKGDYAPTTAHEVMMTAKQFIRRMAEMRMIPLPGNIDSRRFKFNHSAPKKIEVFTAEEVKALLDKATDRMKLYLLLMVNCGMYQSDVAELRNDEIDLRAGTITRARSKTRERGGPVVTYKLWPDTLKLLKRFQTAGEIALTTERGGPLVSMRIEDGKMKRSDSIQAAWVRMGKGRLPMKHLRKTAATLLGQHPQYKYYSAYFLADSPKGMDQRHYVVPSEPEFLEALEWLGKKFE